MAEEMASKCHGLPLAIVVLGGLLRGKDPDQWPRLTEHMWRHVRDHDSRHVQHILASSFNDLPHRLKSCFLYSGLFPEDFEIDAKKLCRLWMAEGFIKQGKESCEEETEAYLRELIDRSLIQVVQRNWRRIITCRVQTLEELKGRKDIGRPHSLDSLPTSKIYEPAMERASIDSTRFYWWIKKPPILGLVDWKLPIEVLPNLKYLCLQASGLTEDPMPMLEKLPKLTVLFLDSYLGKKLVCTALGFPQLEIVQLTNASLKEIQVGRGGMPVLMGLLIIVMSGYVSMPDRLRSIPAPDPSISWSKWG